MELFDLKGKTALIVGASSGLGKQAAICLSNAGARVILAARRYDRLEDLANKLDNAIALKMDIADKISVQNAFKQIEANNEKIDICINSAGLANLTPIFEEDNDGDFETIMQTNVIGTWYVTKDVANHMKSFGIQGSIINFASVNGAHRLRENLTGYSISKAAVIHMTKALVGELSHHQIRINCIIPGIFHTLLTDYKLNTPELQKTMKDTIPLGFVAKPNDLDGTILYLASNALSSYVTGSCLTIDGGVSWGG